MALTTARILVAVLSFSLAACSTTVVSTRRAAATSEAVQSLSVIFIAGAMGTSGARPSDMTLMSARKHVPLGARSDGLAAELRDLGGHVNSGLPSALQTAGLSMASAPVLSLGNVAGPAGLDALLSNGQRAPVLTIKPVSAAMECAAACYAFRVEVELLAADRATPLWSGTFDLPPKASRFSDHSTPAASFIRAMVEQMRKDGVVQ